MSGIVLSIFLFPACGKTAKPQEKVVEEKTYRFVIPKGWERSAKFPDGFDVTLRKELPDAGLAYLFFHHEILAPYEPSPPARSEEIEKEWHAIIKTKYPAEQRIVIRDPVVKGRLLGNIGYRLPSDRTELRDTKFISGRTIFLVECITYEKDWPKVVEEFDLILGTLEELEDSFLKAVVENDLGRVTKWLKKGVDVNEPERPSGWCALHYAAKSGNEEMVKLLLDNGADPKIAGAGSRQVGNKWIVDPQMVVEVMLYYSKPENRSPMILSECRDMLALLDAPGAVDRYKRILEMLHRDTKEKK